MLIHRISVGSEARGYIHRDLPIIPISEKISVSLLNIRGDWELTEALGKEF